MTAFCLIPGLPQANSGLHLRASLFSKSWPIKGTTRI